MYARVQFKLALPYRLKCTLYFRRYANEDHQRVRTLSCINTILIPATAAGSHENVPSPFSRSPLHRFLHIRSLVSRVSICGSDRLLVSESHLLVATRTIHVSNILFHLYIFSSVFSFLPRSHPFFLSLSLSISISRFLFFRFHFLFSAVRVFPFSVFPRFLLDARHSLCPFPLSLSLSPLSSTLSSSTLLLLFYLAWHLAALHNFYRCW